VPHEPLNVHGGIIPGHGNVTRRNIRVEMFVSGKEIPFILLGTLWVFEIENPWDIGARETADRQRDFRRLMGNRQGKISSQSIAMRIRVQSELNLLGDCSQSVIFDEKPKIM
jgi:hypothetical protein